MQDSSAVVISYINSSLCKCILPQRLSIGINRRVYPHAIITPARKYYARFTSAKGNQTAVLRLSQPGVLSRRSCEIILADDPGRLTVARLVLYELVPHEACVHICGRRKRALPGQETAACVAAGLLRG